LEWLVIFRDFVIALRRNWGVALVVAAITLVLVAHDVTTKPTYQTRAVITLLSPEAPFPRNAYASFTPGLVVMSDVLAKSMTTAAARRTVVRDGGRGEFQVVLFNRGSEQYPIFDEPYLTVTTNAPSPAEAMATQRAVLAALDKELQQRQAKGGARPGSYISWRVTADTASAIMITGQPSRQLLATMILGFVVAVYASLLSDRHGHRLRSALRGLRRRRLTTVPPAVPTVDAGSR
jgi:hypothetical protein